MLNRILITIAVFLAILTGFLYFRVNSLIEQNTTLRSQKNELSEQIKGYENEIQKYNTAQEKAGETIEKVRTVIKTVKSDCDCYNTSLPDELRKLLK